MVFILYSTSLSASELSDKNSCRYTYITHNIRDLRNMSGLEQKLVLSYACTHQCLRACLKWKVYKPLGTSLFENVPLVEFLYRVFTRMPGRVTVGDSGLCCCVPRLSSAIISLC